MWTHVTRALSNGIHIHPLGHPYTTILTHPQLARRQTHLRRRNCTNGVQCDAFLGTHGNGNTFGCTGSNPLPDLRFAISYTYAAVAPSLIACCHLLFNSPRTVPISVPGNWQLGARSNPKPKPNQTETETVSVSEKVSQVGALFVRPLRCSRQERVTHWTLWIRTAGLGLQFSRSPTALSYTVGKFGLIWVLFNKIKNNA